MLLGTGGMAYAQSGMNGTNNAAGSVNNGQYNSQYNPGNANGASHCQTAPGPDAAGGAPCGPNQTHSAGSGR
jgi:hypothetical protein